AAGDELLKHCAGYLRKGIRPADKLYRWGGDEFLIVMPEADAESASVRLRNLVLELPPFTLPDRKAEKKVSISVGVARFTSAEDLKLAVNLADESMYEYKRYQKRRTVK
ncbi:MAG: GGDEF domain-containing protein, partial [Gammaproteobacteria bacterium]|nr:GGDEF domain-containing protein [Gammaproteobacteria bacterium]